MEEAILALLKEMGLSDYQARVLFALFRLGKAEAKEVSEVSGVPVAKVYGILSDLAKRGYVIEISTRPKQYAVFDPATTLRRMVREMRERVERLEEKVQKITSILPLFREERESTKGNYIVRLRGQKEVLRFVTTEALGGTACLTPESRRLLPVFPGEVLPSPTDFFIVGKKVILPLNPIYWRGREHTLIIIQDKHIVKLFEGWVRELRRDSKKIRAEKRG